MRKKLENLRREEEALKRKLNNCYNKYERSFLFDKLEIVNEKIAQLKFKIKLKEALEKIESRN